MTSAVRLVAVVLVLVPVCLLGLAVSAMASVNLPTAAPSIPLTVPTSPALPTSTPTMPAAGELPVPTPSLLAILTSSTPTPSQSASPSPTPAAAAGAVQTSPSGPRGNKSSTPAPSITGGVGSGGSRGGDIVLPSVTLPGGALGVGLVVAIAALPFLLGVGLLLLGRVWGEARRLGNARLRMALAAELELKPRELAHLNTQKLMRLRDQITFDELSGVLRRVAGIASLDREIARARRSGTTLVAAFVDLDGLKSINDSRGHATGDTLIRGVAQLLQRGLRRDDLVFRYGGDEFVCALPGSSLEAGEAKMRELRSRAVKNSMSFSFGVTQLGEADDLVSFLGRADQFLYDQRSQRERELAGLPVVLPLGARPAATSRRAVRPRRTE